MGPGGTGSSTSGWAWPVTEDQVRHGLQERGLRLAVVRLFPGREKWWNEDQPKPVALLTPLLPDLAERLQPYSSAEDGHLPAELRVWGVPVLVAERVADALLEGLPRLLDWLVQAKAGHAVTWPPEQEVLLRFDGDTVKVS